MKFISSITLVAVLGFNILILTGTSLFALPPINGTYYSVSCHWYTGYPGEQQYCCGCQVQQYKNGNCIGTYPPDEYFCSVSTDYAYNSVSSWCNNN